MSHQAASDTQITISSRPVCQFGDIKGLNGAATVCVDDIMTVEQRCVHRRDTEVRHSAKIYPTLNSWCKTHAYATYDTGMIHDRMYIVLKT